MTGRGPKTGPSAAAAVQAHLFDKQRPEQDADVAPGAIMFEYPEVAAAFEVNTERRTISGLLVPWGKVAKAGTGGRWRFVPGSLHWSDVTRVKLNLHHDRRQTIAKAIQLESGTEGLFGTFKVAPGAEGDRALTLADAGVLDGFSIEPSFEDDDDEWIVDPSDRSVRLVRRAKLRGVGLLPMPAFDDARVSSVAASLQEGGGMPPDKEPQTTDNGQQPGGTVALDADEFSNFMKGLADDIAGSHKTLTEHLGESIGESVSAGFKAALESIHDPQRDGPEPVRAARFTVTRERPIYTLDGNGPSLVKDAWYAQKEHDDEARDRLHKFHQQTTEVQKLVSTQIAFQSAANLKFATVDTTSAADVIPPGYRPDLFVPQLAQGRPFVNALSRGTISNPTPFVVPVFGSAAGMTGDHTEGDPPTEGTLAFGVKTVSPGAISGKLPLTREIVDSANPAIDAIALAAMREDYAQRTEAKVYTMLNGAAGQGGTVTAGFVPSGAQVFEPGATITDGADLLDAIREQLANYPFRRFASPNQALISQRATVAFAGAKDQVGRPLVASVNSQNAAASGNAVQAAYDVDGLQHRPAWAITGSAAGDGDVFTIAQPDGWVWESPLLSFRFEEKQGPEVIELALFGYFATHLLRPVGLSTVRMNAAGV